MRPKNILLKYKELLREASRDEITLVNLENQSQLNNLELAKKEQPWELITKPTLTRYPVAPNKKIFAIFSLIVGFFFGLGAALFKEKKSDLIYDLDVLEKLFPKSNVSNEMQGVYSLPTTILFDKKGNKVETIVGVLDFSDENLINKFLKY